MRTGARARARATRGRTRYAGAHALRGGARATRGRTRYAGAGRTTRAGGHIIERDALRGLDHQQAFLYRSVTQVWSNGAAQKNSLVQTWLFNDKYFWVNAVLWGCVIYTAVRKTNPTPPANTQPPQLGGM
jgi:hypothetical protein